jgi:hypothetical protein
MAGKRTCCSEKNEAMTEQEWQICTDRLEMLRFLQGKVSERKLRLFACACCRAIWSLFRENICRQAIALSEKFADGRVGVGELHKAVEAASRDGRRRRPSVKSRNSVTPATPVCRIEYSLQIVFAQELS